MAARHRQGRRTIAVIVITALVAGLVMGFYAGSRYQLWHLQDACLDAGGRVSGDGVARCEIEREIEREFDPR
ncbi:hypothetical protein [Halomonas sp. DN3]|uniref:hypothetical protein n=1 Tax=Halomonas sp. DN3 TaxID=2953657 RepID=UPI0020A167F2|nr:hypothetical protein [Halomonas sp. DN3]USZ51821.1 hypothetical protein NKF27_10145 [Halomonas sp. DN3]